MELVGFEEEEEEVKREVSCNCKDRSHLDHLVRSRSAMISLVMVAHVPVEDVEEALRVWTLKD